MYVILGLTVGPRDFLRGYEYYYYGGHPLTWSDSGEALRVWRVGVQMYAGERGLRVVGNDLDLNDDGKLDVVLLNNEWYFRHDYQPYYLNLGGGRFESHLWRYKSDTLTAIDGGWLGDIDGDGGLELVVGVMEKRVMSGVMIYRDFPWNEYDRDTIGAGSVETPTVGDVNGDGWLDIVAGVWRDDEEERPDGTECSKVFYGSREGYSRDRSSGCLWGGGTHVVLIADFNYDTYPDVFVGSTYYGFEAVHPPRIYYGGPGGIDTGRYSLVWTDPPPYDSFGTYGGTIGDLNRDGRLDIVGCHNDRIFVLWGMEGGGYSPDSEDVFSSEACKAVQVGDLDGNGLLDIVASQKTGGGDWREGKVVILYNYGGGKWKREELPSPGSNGILIHDFNGDGWPDIVSFEKEHDYSVIFWNLGYGGFLPNYLTPLYGTHKAARGLTVQIFGNLYDRSDSLGYLSPEVRLGSAMDLYGVEVFGNLAGQRVSLYVRGRRYGRMTPWVLVSPGKPLSVPVLNGIESVQYRIVLHLNYSTVSLFHIDSLRFRFVPRRRMRWETWCSPFRHGVAIYSSIPALYSIYDLSGRLVGRGRVEGGEDRVGLPTGAYFVVFVRGTSSKTCKVIVPSL